MGRGRGGEAVILHPQAWEGLGNPAVMVSPRPGYRLWVGLLSLGSSHPDLALSVLPPSPLCLALVLSPLPRACALSSSPPILCTAPHALPLVSLALFSLCGWLPSCASISVLHPAPVCPVCFLSLESVCLLLLSSVSLFVSSCFLPAICVCLLACLASPLPSLDPDCPLLSPLPGSPLSPSSSPGTHSFGHAPTSGA